MVGVSGEGEPEKASVEEDLVGEGSGAPAVGEQGGEVEGSAGKDMLGAFCLLNWAGFSIGEDNGENFAGEDMFGS